VGIKSTALMNATQTTVIPFNNGLSFPSVYGPGTNSIRLEYIFRAKTTLAYDRSRAGAVMLNIATMVKVEPIPIRFRQMDRKTISHTALRGVWVIELTFAKNLGQMSVLACHNLG